MSALLTANRYGLRCSDPLHREFGGVYATCDERGPLEDHRVRLAVPCFELVERTVDGWVPANVIDWRARGARNVPEPPPQVLPVDDRAEIAARLSGGAQ